VCVRVCLPVAVITSENKIEALQFGSSFRITISCTVQNIHEIGISVVLSALQRHALPITSGSRF
jgi:hypothetical protein